MKENHIISFFGPVFLIVGFIAVVIGLLIYPIIGIPTGMMMIGFGCIIICLVDIRAALRARAADAQPNA